VITLNSISKRYRAGDIETAALADISLEVKEGEFVAVMGPSGCGKSTLLNIIGMIDTPSEGQYMFCGEEVGSYPERRLVELRKQHLGFIFQSFNLLDDLTVYENVELPLLYLNVPRTRRRHRVREVLELVDLEARAHHKPAQLSGGQQQRVAVARAVVSDPKLILADEPTGNLDSRNGEEVMNMIGVLNQQGATVLMVTHSPEHSRRAHRIVDMLDGHIVRSAIPEAVAHA
jgi:putative ABC transport system ATP-binding protein